VETLTLDDPNRDAQDERALALFKRLGLIEVPDGEYRHITVQMGDSGRYDLLELLHAVLDRMDEATM
jgi:hypothetical protein